VYHDWFYFENPSSTSAHTIENTNTNTLIIIIGVLCKTPINVAGVMIENNNDIVALKTMVKNADSLSAMLTAMIGLIRVWKMFFIWFCLGVSEHKKAPLKIEQG
jgi:hypothetical protein